jgi:hypothetical protein
MTNLFKKNRHIHTTRYYLSIFNFSLRLQYFVLKVPRKRGLVNTVGPLVVVVTAAAAAAASVPFVL